MTAYTSTNKGKRVIVTMKDGSRHLDKFVERVGKGVVFESLGFVRGRNMQAMTIYRGQQLKEYA